MKKWVVKLIQWENKNNKYYNIVNKEMKDKYYNKIIKKIIENWFNWFRWRIIK